MLIETPQNDTRALAVIAKARELVPGKPLTQLVNSHHHFDHSGGVRAAISEGLTVITHQGNAAFMEEIAKRPHTIAPDALAMKPKPLTVEGVADKKVISDATMTVNLYAVTGAHSQTMLMAYFPRASGSSSKRTSTTRGRCKCSPAEFLAGVKARNLRVDRIAPLHAQVATYAQFLKDASGPPAATN